MSATHGVALGVDLQNETEAPDVPIAGAIDIEVDRLQRLIARKLADHGLVERDVDDRASSDSTMRKHQRRPARRSRVGVPASWVARASIHDASSVVYTLSSMPVSSVSG